MCRNGFCDAVPKSEASLTIAYAHETGRWYAQVCRCSLSAENGYTNHGAVTREFGPFDGLADVLQWTYREVATRIRDLPVRDHVSQQVPPQGNEEGPLR